MTRDVTGVLVEFARTLRHAGVDASPDRVASMLTAVDALDVTDVVDTYWAGRVTLCASAEDVVLYDLGFASYFGGYAPVRGLPIPVAPVMPRPAMPFGAASTPSEGENAEAVNISVSAADTEVLRARDVATLS